MQIRKPTDVRPQGEVRQARPSTDTSAVSAPRVQPPETAPSNTAEQAARDLAAKNAGRGAAPGKALVTKSSPVGAFFTKQVELPKPSQVFEAMIRLPLSAFAADVDHLWKLGEAQGKITDGKLHPIELRYDDKRLHNAMTRASFDVALGCDKDELTDVMRNATLSALRTLADMDATPNWQDIGAYLSPGERELVLTAMESLGTSRKAALRELTSSRSTNTAFIEPGRMARGLAEAEHSITGVLVQGEVEKALTDPKSTSDAFARRVAAELHNSGATPLVGADDARRAAIFRAVATVVARDYAGDDGVVDIRQGPTPGRTVREMSNRSVVEPLFWDVLALTSPQPQGTQLARTRARIELAKTAQTFAKATGVTFEDARRQILESLTQRHVADSMRRSLAEDWFGGVEAKTGRLVPLEERLGAHLAKWNAAADSIPQILPMVERAKARIPDDAFKGHLVLTVQHFLGPFVPLMNALKDKGADTKDMVHVGVPYSANTQVELVLKAAGNDVRVPSTVDGMKDAIRAAMTEIIARSKAEGKPILVIDDGGTVTELLQEVFPDEVHRFCIIEQTTRGITAASKAIDKGRETGFKPPVIVDVARSEAKSLEGVQIAPTAIDSIIPALKARAAALPGIGLPDTLEASKPVVFGFGVIGASMARSLKDKGIDVAVWDKSPELRQKARDEGFFVPENRDDVFKGRDLLIGCTGFPSIEAADIPKMEPHAMATSLSSKRIEFDAKIREEMDLRINFLEKASKVNGASHIGTYQERTSIGTEEQLQRFNNHSLTLLFVVENGENRAGPIIVNDMQPINFDHDVFVVPALEIQLTEALLLDGAWQAVRDKRQSGIIAYDVERQKHVLADWADVKPKDAP